jgi:hypothetical protein
MPPWDLLAVCESVQGYAEHPFYAIGREKLGKYPGLRVKSHSKHKLYLINFLKRADKDSRPT